MIKWGNWVGAVLWTITNIIIYVFGWFLMNIIEALVHASGTNPMQWYDWAFIFGLPLIPVAGFSFLVWYIKKLFF